MYSFEELKYQSIKYIIFSSAQAQQVNNFFILFFSKCTIWFREIQYNYQLNDIKFPKNLRKLLPC